MTVIYVVYPMPVRIVSVRVPPAGKLSVVVVKLNNTFVLVTVVLEIKVKVSDVCDIKYSNPWLRERVLALQVALQTQLEGV